MSLPCTCRLIPRGGSRIANTATRSFSTSQPSKYVSVNQSSGSNPHIIDDDSSAAQARRAAENATRRRNVGPFPFVDQPGSGEVPRRPWHDLSGGEKVGRTLVNSSNTIFVVVFGLGLSGLVIYAVSSELFATNSPTKLYEEAAELVKRSPEVNKILVQPLRIHAESSGSRRNRRVHSTVTVDRATGREKMIIRFIVEGKSPDSKEDETWIQSIKRYIRPIIVEPSDPTDLIPAIEPPPPTASESSSSSWLGSIFGSLMPSSYANKTVSSGPPAPSRLRTRPSKGTFTRGEAVATLLMDDKAEFKLDSLLVFWPDRQNWQWKTDVRAQGPLKSDELVEGPPRYRFWSRKG